MFRSQRFYDFTSTRFLYSLFYLLLFCAASHLGAQVTTGTIQGNVTDASGAAVPSAMVTLKNVATNVSTTSKSDSVGRFVFPLLPPGGPYTVSVQSDGFQRFERSGVNLELNQTAEIAVHLALGSSTEVVQVNADAIQLETSTPAVGQVIENKSIVDLPLNQRNVFQLMFLVPGVTGSVTNQYNSLNMSVNGGRPGTTSILIDGIPASPQLIVPIAGFAAFPSVDAVQEFKVELTAYPAQFGRSLSGIVNVVLKSGANALRGSLYEFVRNSNLDANTFFAKRAGTQLPSFSRHQFGGSVSGPIAIPHVYDGHSKSFFLFSYEGLRQGTQSELTTTVPTARQRAGDFSQTFNSAGQQVVIYDPLTTTASGSGYTRSAFPGNVIPSNRIDAVAAAAINYYPLPNQAGTANSGLNNYYAKATTQVNINTFDTRVDHNFSDASRVFVRYSQRGLTQPPLVFLPDASRLASGATSQLQNSKSAAIDFTHTFSSKWVMEIPVGFSRAAVDFVPVDKGFSPTSLGFPAYIAQNADYLLFPQIAPASYLQLGNTNAQRHSGFNVYSAGINNTIILRNHVLTVGGEYRIYQSNDVESPASTGSYAFNNAITQGPNPNAATSIAGNSLASLLLGVGTGTMNINTKNSAVQSKYFAMYLQDDWKATSRLSVNVGIRWDVDLPRTERHNRMETFNPTITSPLASVAGLGGVRGGTVFVGTAGPARRQFDPQLLNFSPRAGISFQVDPNTVVRAAYGLYFGPSLRSSGNLLGNQGFSASTTYTGSTDGLRPSVYLSNPFPNGVNVPVGSSQGLLTGIGSTFNTPLTGDNRVGYTQNWDLDIQRQLPFSILADIAYVGSHGVHLNKGGEGDFNINQLTPATLALGTQLQQSVSNPFYGIIKTGPESNATIARSYLLAPFPQYPSLGLLFPDGGFVLYHSIQAKVSKRLSRGLIALISFTGQKQIDNYSGIENVGRITGGIQNIYNPDAERAVSSNDISRNLVVSATYDLPFGRGMVIGKGWSRTTNLILGGWQINGIMTQQTGFPISVTTQNTSGSGSNVLRPNLTGISPVTTGSVRSRLGGYINTAAFTQPAPFTFGNTPRTLSSVRTPGLHNFDMSLFKNIKMPRESEVQFRFEAFNALNQVQFAAPNTVLTSGQFGVISAQSNTPRQLQFAVKYLF